MKIYLVYSHSYRNILREENVPILINYTYLKKSKDLSSLAEIPKGFPSIIIDSGGYQLQVGVKAVREPRIAAYSFWLENEIIPRHKEVVGYMNLDILSMDVAPKIKVSKEAKKQESVVQIGLLGEDKEIPNEEEKAETLERTSKEKLDSWKRSAELTLKNQEYMEKQGLKPIPVWHAGEPEEYLDYYCSTHDYVAIGGLASLGTPGKSSVMKLMCFCTQKYPSIKFHLFGIGISGLLAFKSLRPYSIDFSTWGVPARYGHNLVEDDKQLLKEIRLPDEERKAIKRDNDLEAMYLREAIRKIKMLDLEKYNDPYQKLLI